MNFLNENTKAYHHNPETVPSINEPELRSWVEMCLKLIRRLPSVRKLASATWPQTSTTAMWLTIHACVVYRASFRHLDSASACAKSASVKSTGRTDRRLLGRVGEHDRSAKAAIAECAQEGAPGA